MPRSKVSGALLARGQRVKLLARRLTAVYLLLKANCVYTFKLIRKF